MRLGPRSAILLLFLLVPGAGEALPTDETLRAVGRLNNSVGGHCTGVLVAPRVAVTAAHCLYNRAAGRWLRPEAIHFLLGYDRGTYAFHATAVAYRTGQADPVAPPAADSGDWAVLTLSSEAPACHKPMALAGQTPPGALASGSGGEVVMAGFARARPYVLTVLPACGAVATQALVLLDCPVPHGVSGGPLVAPDGTLAGIVVATAEDRSLAIAADAFRAAVLETAGGL